MRAIVTKKVTMEFVYEFDACDVSFARVLAGPKALDIKEYVVGWAKDLGEVHASEQRVIGERWTAKLIREPEAPVVATLPPNDCE